MERDVILTGGCFHHDLTCLNPYEFVRKYKCAACNGVMMCGCDEAFGRQFLSHQLEQATELETQARISVNLGFQHGICRECRGQPLESTPLAPAHGRTSKIRRYYWRELYFETERRLAAISCTGPGSASTDNRKRIEREVLKELEALHRAAPKYQYKEISQAEIIRRHGVEIVRLDANYLVSGDKGNLIDDGAGGCAPEVFAASHFETQGFEVMKLESVPFHALFGVFMYLLIQDHADDQVRMVTFGDRIAFEGGHAADPIWTGLPDDFGTRGFARRRRQAIEDHFADMPLDRSGLLWLFDYWVPLSAPLRQYLWAHREDDVRRARRIVQILPAEAVIGILRYLVDDYWARFCGWPDLLVYREGNEFLLVEVKSSSDKLSEDQKHWIEGNATILKLPFKLLKIHRTK